MKKNSGFTLVELILVIVLLGIIGGFTFNYLGFGARIFSDAVGREQAVSQARFALQRLSIELKNSLPRSVQLIDGGNCIEFMPILTSGQYLDIPLADSPTTEFVAIMPAVPTASLNNSYLFVFANELDFIYGSSALRRKRIFDIESNVPDDFLMTVNFLAESPSYFAAQSIGRRYYVSSGPVRWCYSPADRSLRRIAGYPITEAGNFPALNPTSNEVMARDLVNDVSSPPFLVFEPTLTRNNIIQIDLRIERGNTGEPLQMTREVFIPNVP